GGAAKMLGLGRPQISRNVITGNAIAPAIVFPLAEWWRESREFYLIQQDFLFAGRGVHIPKLSVLSSVIALDEGELRIVGTPLDVLGTAARDSTLGKDGLNGQLFLASLRERQRSNKKP